MAGACPYKTDVMTKWCCMATERQHTPHGEWRTKNGEQPVLWRDSFFWLALLLTIFALAPFTQPGYFWGAHDARHHVYFLFEFERLVQDGIWWPRWSPDFTFGYGYPFFNIYGPFSHLLAAVLLRVGGLSYTAAVESIFALGILAAASGMYGYVRSLAGRGAGLLAAVAYTYAPYHLLVLFVRAGLAENSAFAWLPFCLWSFREAVLHPKPRSIVLAALCYGGLMITSNLVFLLFSPLLIIYILALLVWHSWPAQEWRTRLRRGLFAALAPTAGGILGLGLSGLFWLPMLLERNDVRVDQWFAGRYAFRDHFLYIFQLFSPHWGFGISVPGPDDGMSFQLGVALLLLALLGGFIGWRQPSLRVETALFAAAAGVAALLSLHVAAPLWELPIIGGLLQAAQFPWRWLPITMLCLSVLAGLLFTPHPAEIQTTERSLPVIAVVGIVLLASYPLLQVKIIEPVEGPVGLAALMRFERDADELTGSTRWVKEIPRWSPIAEYYVQLDEAGADVTPITTKVDYALVDNQTISVESKRHNTVMEEVYFCTDPGERPGDCSPREDARIIFNQFYYPGWRAYLLDQEHGTPVVALDVRAETAGTLGRISVTVPPVGEGYILLRFEDTWPRTIGKYLTIASLLVSVLLLAVPVFGRTRRRPATT